MGREGQSKRSERIKQEILDTAMEIGIEEGFYNRCYISSF